MEKTEYNIVVLAAGDYPTHPMPRQALRNADLVVCCDSAYEQWHSLNPDSKQPFVVIGDGDSLPSDTQAALGNLFIHISEQETNDLTKSVHYALSVKTPLKKTITIVGATGKREDHTLGNLSLLADYHEQCADIEMLTDYGTFRVFRNRALLSTFKGQQVSIISLTPDVPVSCEGLLYPIKNRCLRRWWEATLNEALSKEALVIGGTLLIFQTYFSK